MNALQVRIPKLHRYIPMQHLLRHFFLQMNSTDLRQTIMSIQYIHLQIIFQPTEIWSIVLDPKLIQT